MPFTNILFPVDFSERSRVVAPHVKAACARFRASLTLLHLVEVPAMAYGTPEAPVVFEFPLEEMKESAEKRLHDLAESEFPSMPVRTVVDEGDPGSCIAEWRASGKTISSCSHARPGPVSRCAARFRDGQNPA